MKQPFKSTLFLVSAALVVLSAPTVNVHAVPATVPTTFCEKVTMLGSTNQTALQAKIAAQDSTSTARISKLSAAQATRDEAVATARSAAEQRFEEKIAQLQDVRKWSDAQLQAITTFQEDVQKAETTRAEAVDAARQTYQTNLADILSGQQTALSQALQVYQSGVQTAFNTATTNCGTEGAATALKASIKAARDKLQAARNPNQVVADIQAISETRRLAISDANKTFESSVQTYAATLRDTLASSNATNDSAVNE
ncbi:MAG TPA: hypothetical protein VL362_00045 [Patescibacteria group bacterium]|jgi:hypothetical protein|nr:hypothetical protein [Patescibacteria group bacterium]